jgi:hypothetical protein
VLKEEFIYKEKVLKTYANDISGNRRKGFNELNIMETILTKHAR